MKKILYIILFGLIVVLFDSCYVVTTPTRTVRPVVIVPTPPPPVFYPNNYWRRSYYYHGVHRNRTRIYNYQNVP